MVPLCTASLFLSNLGICYWVRDAVPREHRGWEQRIISLILILIDEGKVHLSIISADGHLPRETRDQATSSAKSLR